MPSGRRASTARAGRTSLEIRLAATGAHDWALLRLSPLSPLAETEPDASLTIELGYGDALETVLTGRVVDVTRRESVIVIEAVATTEALSRTHYAQAYQQQTAADIVGDLLGQAGVDAGEIEAPLSLAAYHVDEAPPLWCHLRGLARLTGCEISADPQGALNFRPPKSGPFPDHLLRYGADLLAWDLHALAPAGAARKVAPHGAGSELGAASWHILLKQPFGGSPSGPGLVPGALRDRDGAETYEQSLQAASERAALAGAVQIVGNAALRAGDLIHLLNLPGGAIAQMVRAVAVTHRLDGHNGFRSAAVVGGVASGLLGGLP